MPAHVDLEAVVAGIQVTLFGDALVSGVQLALLVVAVGAEATLYI
ncbi:hypothetical protein HMPREF9371_1898 [Neisseria shayeganii 871]|uniref:Uncharacterized protein n=1 Tax=Neisseria shayeganii 871 TaxID=1032488 RepID=G4CJV8_9NEIS|nr:hypothetical protein HMPREF9371_1898 [Neisseria shayeganii 871]